MKLFNYLVTGLVLLLTGTVNADQYKVDPVHSSVVFSIRHADLNAVFGMVPDVEGTFSLDEQGEFNISVGVDSLLSGNPARDNHLKSPDFFSAKQFPRIEFKSKQVRVAEGDLEVQGELTLKGVTKPVLAKIVTATGTGRQGEARGGIQTSLKIKRSDFELGGPGGLGDEVTVMISLQGVKE